jgi:hypothetical protein
MIGGPLKHDPEVQKLALGRTPIAEAILTGQFVLFKLEPKEGYIPRVDGSNTSTIAAPFCG